MNRMIKLMPDFQCYSIWISENGGVFKNVNPSSLKISEKLLKRIDDWENTYESTLNMNDPIKSRFPDEVSKIDFELRGAGIWKALIEELKTDTVSFYSVINEQVYTEENYVHPVKL